MRTIYLFLFVLLSNLAFGGNSNYSKGYYIDKEGQKVEGLIYYYSSLIVKYKANKKAKTIKLTPNDIQGFTVLYTKCIVMHNVKTGFGGGTDFKYHKSAFVEEVMKGKINMYAFRTFKSDGSAYGSFPIDVFLLEKDGVITPVRSSAGKFRKQMIALVSDNEALVKRITSEKMKRSDLKTILRAYNRTVIY